MNIIEKRIENQVQFWSLLGPFIILLGIVVLLFKMSSHWYLPVSVLVGIPLCFKWRMKGLAASLAFLITLFIVSYSSLQFDELYWHVGMGMAMALSFVILTLSLEEVQSLIVKLQAESQSRLDNFLRLDGNLKTIEHTWSEEKELLSSNVHELTQTLAKGQEEKQTFQKLVYLAKDELIALRKQHEFLLQDLFYKKQHISQLNERLEENELTIQSFVNTDSEKKNEKLKEDLSYCEAQKEAIQNQCLAYQEQLKQLQTRTEILEQDLRQGAELERIQKEDLKRFEQSHVLQQVNVQEKEKRVQTLEQEKEEVLAKYNNLEKEVARLQKQELAQKEDIVKYYQKVEEITASLLEKDAACEKFHQQNSHFQKSLEQKEELLKSQSEHFERQLKEAIEKHAQESKSVEQGLKQDYQELEKQLEVVKSDHQLVCSGNEQLTQHYTQLQKKLSDQEDLLKQQSEHFDLQRQELEKQLEALKSDYQSVHGGSDQLAKDYSQLQQKLIQQEELSKQQAESFDLKLKETIERLIQENDGVEQALKQESQALEKQLEVLKSNYQIVQSESDQLSKNYSQLQKKLAQQEALSKQQTESFDLQLTETVDRLTQEHEGVEQGVRQEYQALENQLEVLKSAYQLVHNGSEQLTKNYSQAKQSLDALQESFNDSEWKLKEKNQIIQDLESQCQKLDTDLKKADEERVSAKLQLDKLQGNQQKLPAANPNARRLESLYIQLKEQFQEKSTMLDVTRRELFCTQEQLIALQREIDEKQIYYPSEMEMRLQKELRSLHNEYEQDQQQAQEELNALHLLVSDLLKQASK